MNKDITQSIAAAKLDMAYREVAEVEELTMEIYDLSAKSRSLIEAVAAREASIYSEVALKMTDGKPTFTNDTSRKAEFTKISSKDAVLTVMKAESSKQARDTAVQSARLFGLTTSISLIKAFLHGNNS